MVQAAPRALQPDQLLAQLPLALVGGSCAGWGGDGGAGVRGEALERCARGAGACASALCLHGASAKPAECGPAGLAGRRPGDL